MIAINLLIYFAFRRGFKFPEADVILKMTDRSKQPWKKDQEELEELSRLVENLKKPTDSQDNELNEQ